MCSGYKFIRLINADEWKIMENDRFLPTGWHWKITPEQIEKIKQRDRDTVNKVYFANLEKFKRMAYRYCCIRKQYSFFRDCVQQIYVDMLYYDYSDSRTLFWSIKRSFFRACGLSKYCRKSLDEPIGDSDSDSVLADIIPIYDTAEHDYDRKAQEKHALELIAAQTHLTDKAKDILTAIAFDCLCYVGIFDYEYSKMCSA